MSDSKHLTYFKVENFKCFDSFELEDIGQFNLILGDNNVGKTSVLEALLFDEDITKLLNAYIEALEIRFNESFKIDQVNYINDYYRNNDLLMRNENQKSITYQLSCREVKVAKQLFVTQLNKLSEEMREKFRKNYLGEALPKLAAVFYDTKNPNNYSISSLDLEKMNVDRDYDEIPYVASKKIYDYDLADLYSQSILLHYENKYLLVESLKIFNNNIRDVDIITKEIFDEPQLALYLNDTKKLMELSLFGEGIIKLARIILQIVSWRNQRLMIDEIDNGIHYSRMKDFWRTILTAADKNNTQLFITTHSLECLKYLKEVLEEKDMERYRGRTRSYTLYKMKTGSIKAYKYDFDQFEFALTNENEIRGGVL